ncbi:trehalose-phosphatase [Polyangium sorediatum]|uniref:Trehalose 6-phosphate phosphatase n=1 Tax=Polyangium sorediatum TaxID=889274 RepID=A0ABT6P2K5_9BACT|nr:trehalose-phosphatase [Polyangium sorediatum]MDI1434839.1 trehalose-phosphatase [Polyangium sorediatum]
MNEPALLSRIARAASLLVATDFDGTISDITTDPDSAHARDDAFAALGRLTRAPGVHVAVVSGRTMESLLERTSALAPVYRVAEHGAFIEGPDGGTIGGTHPERAAGLSALWGFVEANHARIPGMRFERKSVGVAVHVREVEPAMREAAAEVLDAFRKAAVAAGFEIMEGRQVVEARDPGVTKQTALALLLARLPPHTLVVYAGDDTTDEGAIALARQRDGVGIYVASAERPTPNVEADLVLPGPRAWAELLSQIAAVRSV